MTDSSSSARPTEPEPAPVPVDHRHNARLCVLGAIATACGRISGGALQELGARIIDWLW